MWRVGHASLTSCSRLSGVLARKIHATVVPRTGVAFSIMKLFTDQGNPFLLRVLAARNLTEAAMSVVVIKNEDKKKFPCPGNAKLPFLEVDTGHMLFSANAICRYLFELKNGSGSVTPNPETAALEDHWLEWDSTCLQGSVIPYLTSTICHGKAERSQVSRLEDLLKHLDATLSSQLHLSGARLGLADVVVWGSLFPVLSTPSQFSGSQFEGVTKWFSRLMASEALVKSVQEVTAGQGLAALKNSLLSISGIHVSAGTASNDGGPTHKTSQLKASQAPKQSIKDSHESDEAKQQASEAEKDAALKAWNEGLTKRPSARRLQHPILPKEGEKNILITSALPYVNNVPHLGNIIGCVLSADVFARFCRIRQYNTLYICGTDEYGTATETKALEEGLTPQQICDKYFEIHRDVYKWFNIEFDHFGRTTTEQQTQISQDIFWRLRERGHIAEDSLDQLQCQACKRFLADRFVEGTCPFCNYEDARGDQCDSCGKLINAIELKNPHCKVCGGKTEVRTSKHLFLNLTELEPTLKDWVDKSSNEGKWTSNARHITRGWIQEGLKPRCITRDLKWGTPVPLEGYTDKVFYVWFDAPIGYLSITANYTTEWEKWWKNPEQVTLYQFMAKDNVPFHTVVFPSTLLGTDDPYTLLNSISATEYLNYEEDKFSKSRGVGVFGNNAAETGIPADVWRFYLLYLRPENQDSAFCWSDFVLKNNSELLNNLGNFVNRALSFLHNNFEGVVPKMELNEDDKNFVALINRELATYIENLENIRLRDGLRDVLSISKLGNQYMQANKPWVLVKGSASDKSRAGTIIGLAANVSWLISLLVHPYMPQVSAEIQRQLQVTDDGNVLVERFIPYVQTGHKIGTPSPLFQKIDPSFADELRARYAGKKKAPANKVDSGDIESLKAQVTEQGDKVRKLKAEKAEKEKIDAEVKTLLSLKKELARAEGKDPKESAAGSKGKKKGKK